LTIEIRSWILFNHQSSIFNHQFSRGIIPLVEHALPSLLLFARTPKLGKVKTRLVPPLSEPEAHNLYLAFLEDAAAIYLEPGR